MSALEISQLTPEERLGLIEQLWDSLTTNGDAVPLTSTQREELDSRLDEMDREGLSGIPWDDVLSQIRTRLK